MSQATTTVDIVDEEGLHARPAAKIVEMANEYECAVSLSPANDGNTVSASSMMAVSSLNLQQGDTLQITADGPQAEAAIAAIEEWVSSQ